MNKKFFIALAVVLSIPSFVTNAACFSASAFSQDILVKKNGDIIEAKILEINETNIKYKNYSNQEGPTYSINIENVYSIKFENGQSEIFSASSSDNNTSQSNYNPENQVTVSVKYGDGKTTAPPKIVAGLCNIFLSPLGIGHFIVGQVGRGILDILFCWTGIPELIGLIEGIVWICMPNEQWIAKFGY